MGQSHALSGAAVWLGGSLAAQHLLHYQQTPVQLAVGTAISAGAALLNDLDQSGRVTTCQGGATIARTFGPVSLFAAECVEKGSLAVYRATATRWDGRRDNGHRTLTHTLPFPAVAGLGAWLLATLGGRWAVFALLLVLLSASLRALLPKQVRREGWVLTTVFAALASFAATLALQAGRRYPLLGIAVGVGALVHIGGDMLTVQGCPVLWPLVYRGKRWWCVRLWLPLACHTGKGAERYWWRPVFTVAAAGFAVLLADPGLLAHHAALG